MKSKLFIVLSGAALLLSSCGKNKVADAGTKPVSLLNVSYDPTREFYIEVNDVFTKQWKKDHGQDLRIDQSHGGSGKQARSVIDGIEADVVTLALSLDIDMIHKERDLLPADWQKKLPNNSSPYTSTIVFVVRKGNPKGIKDWGDLVTPGTQVITPNPKTGGAPRWCYLAGWAWGRRAFSNDEVKVQDFIKKLYQNVPVLDSGARGSTTTFAQRNIGDVLLSWENEAHLIEKEFPGQTEIVYPSISILAEPSVAVVEKNTAKKGTTAIAKAYLDFLYTEAGQDLAGKHYYRPRDPKIAEKYKSIFPAIQLVNIDEEFGGWVKAQKTHFADGGIFDQIYVPK
ncbi:sulfate ABC transporter substrate-binding protein [Luteolibacter yonseiensis]|uniref:Sulfate ABC transporter substrate-binding protein n=1 Tax=Luteolibacter yonseiensis TaxID=1144680 RepID=A0A934R0R3_9BACT|nr:sulfate ABC transporter substrate-binding protein [Luteolibacter yonseiensis]MBK1814033.1 sulfate ABC transporter substrate-binding protein [Luteolibacter yonseiensis]